jgi:hypothetical protein
LIFTAARPHQDIMSNAWIRTDGRTCNHEDDDVDVAKLEILEDGNGRRYSFNPTTGETSWIDEENDNEEEECGCPHTTLQLTRYMNDWEYLWNPEGGTRIDIINEGYGKSWKKEIESIGFEYHRGRGGDISYTHSGRQYADALDGPYKDNTPEDTERRLIKKGVPKRYIEVLVQSPNRFRTVSRRTVPRSIADPNAQLLQRAAKHKRQKQARKKQRADLAEVQRTQILKQTAAKRRLLPVASVQRVQRVVSINPRDKEICGFGKHKNKKTLLWIYKNDKSYCNWALGKKNTYGPLKEFVGYLKCKNGSASKNVAGNKRPRQNLHETATPQRKVRQRRSDGGF